MTIVLALAAALSFGGLTVAVRWGLARADDPQAGALVAAGVAAAVAGIASAPTLSSEPFPRHLVPFVCAGAIAPGLSQLVLSLAVARAGAARTAILMGSAPMLSVLLAVFLLGEPVRLLVVVGTGAIVVGAALLGLERARPAEFEASGLGLALVCALLFASRDNLLRWGASGSHPPTAISTAALLTVAFFVILVCVEISRRGRLSVAKRTVAAFAPAGAALAAGYELLSAALARGDVSLVSPLNATGSLWAVLFAACALGGGDTLGRRTAAAAILVVAGGIIVGFAS